LLSLVQELDVPAAKATARRRDVDECRWQGSVDEDRCRIAASAAIGFLSMVVV